MPTPRLTIVLLAATLALVVTSPASAGPADRVLAGTGSTLMLANGRGLAIVASSDGSLLGKIAKGRITFTNRLRGTATKFNARKWGCERRRRPARRTIVCIGRNLHFSIVNGAWTARLEGRGIAASAVVTGRLSLRGTRGSFSIDGAPRQRWPETLHTYKLG